MRRGVAARARGTVAAGACIVAGLAAASSRAETVAAPPAAAPLAAAHGTADPRPTRERAEGAAPQLATRDPLASAPRSLLNDRRTLGRLPASVGRGFAAVVHRDSLLPLLAGGALSGAGSFADAPLRRAVAQPANGFGRSFETVGDTPATVAFVGSLFVAGRLAGGTRFRAATYDALDATVVNFGYTSLLKIAAGRHRPDHSNSASFPSGHTSNAFALATVAERHYGWKVGVPLYAVSAAMGWSRMVRDKHHLSDVLAGATLGIVVGRAVTRANGGTERELSSDRASWAVSPLLGRDSKGLLVRVSF